MDCVVEQLRDLASEASRVVAYCGYAAKYYRRAPADMYYIRLLPFGLFFNGLRFCGGLRI